MGICHEGDPRSGRSPDDGLWKSLIILGQAAAGGNPGGCLFLGERLWSARRNLSTRSRGKSWLCGLRRENAVWVKRKVIVIWIKKRNCCLGQKESPSCVV